MKYNAQIPAAPEPPPGALVMKDDVKIRLSIVRYTLIGLAWLLVFVALPLPAGNLNAFLRWRGEPETWFFLRWLLSMPRQVIQDALKPDTLNTDAFYWMDAVWMLVMVLGLLLVFFAPVLVHRVRKPAAITIVRCLAPAMLLLPVTLFMPVEYRFPVADIGLWLVAAAHVLGFVALILRETVIAPETSFPINVDRR